LGRGRQRTPRLAEDPHRAGRGGRVRCGRESRLEIARRARKRRACGGVETGEDRRRKRLDPFDRENRGGNRPAGIRFEHHPGERGILDERTERRDRFERPVAGDQPGGLGERLPRPLFGRAGDLPRDVVDRSRVEGTRPAAVGGDEQEIEQLVAACHARLAVARAIGRRGGQPCGLEGEINPPAPNGEIEEGQ
jgi:hypothetical protein